MAAIPGWVYIILGIVMIAASQIINTKTGTNSLTIFLYAGILFIVIGVGKYILRAVFKKKPKETKRPIPPVPEPVLIPEKQRFGTRRAQHQPAHAQQHHAQPQQPHHQQPHHQASHPQAQQAPPQTHPAHHQAPAQHQHTHRTPQHEVNHMRGQHEVHRAAPQQRPQHMSVIACPACGTSHYNYANYCMKCGSRIK